MPRCYECDLGFDNESVFINKNGKNKKIVIYPAMWVEPEGKDTIYISDYFARYAKPYSLKKIVDQLDQ